MKINLFIGNHKNDQGIRDIVSIFKSIMHERRIQLEISSELDSDAINLVIDEFTSCECNQFIKQFKINNPGAAIIYILTEFFTSRFGIISLNLFGNIFDVTAALIFDIYLKHTIQEKNFLRTNYFVKVALKLMLFSPLIVSLFLKEFIATRSLRMFFPKKFIRHIINKYQSVYYFQKRCVGLFYMLQYCDGVIASHDKIFENYLKLALSNKNQLNNLGTFMPEINEITISKNIIDKKKCNFIEITGTVTNYRMKWVSIIDKHVRASGMPYGGLGFCKIFPFSTNGINNSTMKRGAFSLHPPQTENWQYCSPTRIYRALCIDCNIPIITKNFKQNPIEDICIDIERNLDLSLLQDLFESPENKKLFLMPRVKNYNQVARYNNDNLIKKIYQLIR